MICSSDSSLSTEFFNGIQQRLLKKLSRNVMVTTKRKNYSKTNKNKMPNNLKNSLHLSYKNKIYKLQTLHYFSLASIEVEKILLKI